MQTLLRSTWLIARTQFPRTAFSRRVLLCLLIALGPAVLPLVVQAFGRRPPPSVEMVVYPGFFLVLQVVVPVLALILGSTVVSEDIEDRTITYVFTRPVPRAALLLGRWLVVAALTTALLALSGGALAAAARFGGNPPERAQVPAEVVTSLIAMAVAGGLVYTALFAALGTSVKHPMIVGLAYVFAIEGFLANLPGRSQALTVQFYLRSVLAERGGEAWLEIEQLRAATLDPAGEALATLAVVLVAALVLGAWTIGRRQILLTS
jgi:ABC-type transport system involved in multi-copper enzyme maturation permease subunit